MGYFLETWTIKAAGWLALSLVTFTVLYLIAQSILEKKPLFGWPLRIGAVFAAAYAAVPVADLGFGIRYPGLQQGDELQAFIAACIGSGVALVAAIVLDWKLTDMKPAQSGGLPRTQSGEVEQSREPSQLARTPRPERISTSVSHVKVAKNQPYEDRVRDLQQRVSSGELRIVHAIARPLGERTARQLAATQERREFGAVLERNQTWWFTAKGMQIEVSLALDNATDEPLRSIVLELWDRCLPGPPLVRLLFQITLEQPIPSGALALAKATLSLPSRHPALHGVRVNLAIDAASPFAD